MSNFYNFFKFFLLQAYSLEAARQQLRKIEKNGYLPVALSSSDTEGPSGTKNIASRTVIRRERRRENEVQRGNKRFAAEAANQRQGIVISRNRNIRNAFRGSKRILNLEMHFDLSPATSEIHQLDF